MLLNENGQLFKPYFASRLHRKKAPKCNRNGKVLKTNPKLAFEKLQLFLNADLEESRVNSKSNNPRNCRSSIKSRHYGQMKLPRRHYPHFNTRNVDNNNVSLNECISNSYCRIQNNAYKFNI
jgi:hypothetical protein